MIQTHGLCVSAAEVYQLSYEAPSVGPDQLVEFIFTRDRSETWNFGKDQRFLATRYQLK